MVEEVKPCPGILAKESAVSVDDELGKLSNFLKVEANRVAFHSNARQAMDNAGIVWNGFPPGFIDTLQALTSDDMGVVSRLNVKLRGGLTAAERSIICQFPV